MSLLSLVLVSMLACTAMAGLIPEHETLALPAHIALPPPISTFSFVSLNPHNPTSYSGFTNHGRGHLSPGYSVQFRQDGFGLPQTHHHF